MSPDTYSKYSDKQLSETYSVWMSVYLGAKSPAQRARAERGAAVAAAEMRKRAGLAK